MYPLRGIWILNPALFQKCHHVVFVFPRIQLCSWEEGPRRTRNTALLKGEENHRENIENFSSQMNPKLRGKEGKTTQKSKEFLAKGTGKEFQKSKEKKISVAFLVSTAGSLISQGVQNRGVQQGSKRCQRSPMHISPSVART